MSISAFEQSESCARGGRIGIIDIGSNSIRLVVYDQLKRSPVPIYNEKVMCALGKGLATSGMLNPEGVKLARQTLKRLIAMGKNMEITSLHIMATAAMRDAKDGTDFARSLEKMYGIEIDIISGDKEARLGAFGVASSIHRPEGITGDLGGGSMELVWMEAGKIKHQDSVLLGSLRMLDECKGDRNKLRKLVDKRFGDITWFDDHKADTFYAIGGSFRALAKMHMTANGYPVRILHEYTVDAKNLLKFARDIAAFPDDKIEKFPGVAAKRAPALPGAALVLEKIIETAGAKRIIFSASGIREGYLYEKLTPSVRGQDGLLASCTEFATKSGRTTAYAQELFTWMYPLLKDESEGERRLRFAFCLLSDIALHIHPEYRAEWAFQRILFSSLASLTHRERVTLACALYHRYQFKLKENFPALPLITDRDRAWAKLIGTSANLAYHVSGNIAGNLHQTMLTQTKNGVELKLSGSMQDVMGDAVKKRIDGVSEACKTYMKCRIDL
jgi:exopolyphosphatase/guanosine-5'-triphosphate,3'-diphosphate pyrophosphatase